MDGTAGPGSNVRACLFVGQGVLVRTTPLNYLRGTYERVVGLDRRGDQHNRVMDYLGSFLDNFNWVFHPKSDPIAHFSDLRIRKNATLLVKKLLPNQFHLLLSAQSVCSESLSHLAFVLVIDEKTIAIGPLGNFHEDRMTTNGQSTRLARVGNKGKHI
jgi:hypothetical protein